MSATVLTASEQPAKKINIDFSSSRRTSFLPDVLLNESESTREKSSLKAVRILEYHEDDVLLSSMYLGGTDFEQRPLKKFCTGSKYLGQWSKLGLAGKGIYKYPHGVIYDGYFNRNGEFHGTGILVYPNGQKSKVYGEMESWGDDTNFVTKAGIVMNKNYCRMPDRRFQIELEKDFNPPGEEYLTDEMPPPRNIPPGCYDLVEGFYDPRVKTVYAYTKNDSSKVYLSESKQSMFTGRKSENVIRKESKYAGSAVAIGEVSKKTNSDSLFDALVAGRNDRSHESAREVSWIPTTQQENWITHNCRKSWDEGTGYRPDLYEKWTKGCSDVPEENAVRFAHTNECILDKLKLSGKKTDFHKADEPQFYSFIQAKKDEQEVKTLNTLKKLFLGKGIDLIDLDTRDRVLSVISEYYVLPGEKK